MDDMTWCPLPSCGSIAIVHKAQNAGRCQHCELHFCLDCKKHVHPFRRCLANRIDLLVEYQDHIRGINEANRQVEAKLNDIYMKNCTKQCPNNKCKARITLVSGGCSQV